MVNLNRQIAVARARAGGFSAHVLPGVVGYQAPEDWTFAPQSALTVIAPSGSLSTTLNRAVDQGWLTSGFVAGGGPYFGANAYRTTQPAGDSVTTIPFGTDVIELTSSDPTLSLEGKDGFTIEAWAQNATDAGWSVGFFNKSTGERVLLYCNIVSVFQVAPYVRFGLTATNLEYEPSDPLRFPNRVWQFSGDSAVNAARVWHHIAASFNRDTISIWFDGAPLTSLAGIDSGPGLSTDHVVAGGGQWFVSSVDNFICHQHGTGSGEGQPAMDTRTHFSRLSHRAVYTTNFTPPQL